MSMSQHDRRYYLKSNIVLLVPYSHYYRVGGSTEELSMKEPQNALEVTKRALRDPRTPPNFEKPLNPKS